MAKQKIARRLRDLPNFSDAYAYAAETLCGLSLRSLEDACDAIVPGVVECDGYLLRQLANLIAAHRPVLYLVPPPKPRAANDA